MYVFMYLYVVTAAIWRCVVDARAVHLNQHTAFLAALHTCNKRGWCTVSHLSGNCASLCTSYIKLHCDCKQSMLADMLWCRQAGPTVERWGLGVQQPSTRSARAVPIMETVGGFSSGYVSFKVAPHTT